MTISFIKGKKKLAKPTWPCVKKVIAPLIKYQITRDLPHFIER